MRRRTEKSDIGVRNRLLSAILAWTQDKFLPSILRAIEEVDKNNSPARASVGYIDILHYDEIKPFDTASPRLYYTKATLSTLWRMITPSGSVTLTIHFIVAAKVCVAEGWEGVTNFEIEDIKVEGSDISCGRIGRVTLREIYLSEIKEQGKEALSRLEPDAGIASIIAQFILLHLSTPLHRLLSLKTGEIASTLIHLLNTLPPIEVKTSLRKKDTPKIVCKIKEVARGAKKVFAPITTVWERGGEVWVESKLMVVVRGVMEEEKEGVVKEIKFGVVANITLTSPTDKKEGKMLEGKFDLGIDGEEMGSTSRPRTLGGTYTVFTEIIEASVEGLQRFLDKVIRAIREEEIEKLIKLMYESDIK